MDAGLASVASSGNNPIVKRTLAGGKDAAVQTVQGGARQIDSMESIDSKFGTSLRIRDFVRAAIVWDCVTRIQEIHRARGSATFNYSGVWPMAWMISSFACV